MTDPCLCRRPRPGPLYWDWRCMTCSGHIVGWWTRRKLRREAAAASSEEERHTTTPEEGR